MPAVPDRKPDQSDLMPADEFVALGMQINSEYLAQESLREEALKAARTYLDFAHRVRQSAQADRALDAVRNEIALAEEARR